MSNLIDKFISDTSVHKNANSYRYLGRIRKDPKYRRKHERKKFLRFINSEHKVVITNKAGWKVRVNLLKAFLVGTPYRMTLKIQGKKKIYRADYFTFDLRRLYRRMMKDDALFDELMQMFYFLHNSIPVYLQRSRLLRFLTKLERAMYRHKFGSTRYERQEVFDK
jgi:hypothetical protein